MTIEVSSLLLTSVVVSLDHAILYRGDENEKKFSWFQMMQFLDSVVLYRGDENERKNFVVSDDAVSKLLLS